MTTTVLQLTRSVGIFLGNGLRGLLPSSSGGLISLPSIYHRPSSDEIRIDFQRGQARGLSLRRAA
jgi:hypothetical protein